MNLKKFGTLFFTTALVGILLGLLTALSGQFNVSIMFGVITGGFLSATAMMGFWGYLMLNFTMRSFISFRLWVIFQALIIALVYFDLVYFRFMITGEGEGSIWPYVGYATWPLLLSAVFAYMKARISGMRSFIPALFFLYVFTGLEWFIALKSGAVLQMTVIGIILIGCNAYILLMYTRLLNKPSTAK